MNKLFNYTLILLFAITGLTANAQCTPSTSEAVDITNIGALQLCEGVPYDNVISLSIPSSYNLNGTQGGLDSIQINSISVIDTYGLDYECHNASCVFQGGDYGCLRIFGTPNAAVANASANINANIGLNLGFGSLWLPESFPLAFTIEDAAVCNPNVGIGSTVNNELTLYPSPLKGSVLHFSSELNNATIYDLVGNEIISNINGTSVNVRELSSGMYLLKSESGLTKFIIE